MVGEKGDVLKGLEDHVESALRQCCGVEHAILTFLGTLQELAQPCVEGRET